jgi:hypothetical protein
MAEKPCRRFCVQEVEVGMRKRTVLLLPLLLALAACGEPSEKDLQSAVKEDLHTRALAAGSTSQAVDDLMDVRVAKHECHPFEDGYLCSFTLKMRTPLFSTRPVEAERYFKRKSWFGGWRLEGGDAVS